MSTRYFSYTGGLVVVSIKKRARTHYAEVMFLQQVESVGHIVHFGASGVQNVDVPFFMLE
jgi:hypothetical protein